MNKERDEIMPPVSSEGSNIYFTIKLSFQGGYFKHILTTIFILLLD